MIHEGNIDDVRYIYIKEYPLLQQVEC